MVLLGGSLVRGRQAPLRARYRQDPEQATIVKRAATQAVEGGDALHGLVAPDPRYGVSWPYGIDRAVGGLHDLPNPGELLCVALAACQDATMRMLADLLGVELLDLTVEVTGTLDVRGTLGLDPAVPVGFQRMTCTTRVTVPAGTDLGLLARLEAGARRSCVNLDTLRRGVPVAASTRFDSAPQEGARMPPSHLTPPRSAHRSHTKGAASCH
ncbi:MAG TPA: OsmC family protein [Actinomycetota bacterium]|nr:OsmC family protein [Actinomycetota bacterium]